MKDKDDKLNDLARFLQDQVNKLHDIMEPERYECRAVWLTYKVNGSVQVPVDSFIQVKDGRVVPDSELESDDATHKIVGIYSNLSGLNVTLILIDVITNEPSQIQL